jgi:hypothetical protein
MRTAATNIGMCTLSKVAQKQLKYIPENSVYALEKGLRLKRGLSG